MSILGVGQPVSPILLDRLKKNYDKLRSELLNEATQDGHWVGELSPSALSTATAVSALSVYLKVNCRDDGKSAVDESPRTHHIRQGTDWLLRHQNPDGGWGDTARNTSNISTTVLSLSALQLAGGLGGFRKNDAADSITDGELYVAQAGGVDAIRERYGKDRSFAVPILMNAALAGLVDWTDVGSLPFELSVLPQSWYRFVQLPVVSYAIPALVGVGQAIHHHRPTRNPLLRVLRKWATGPSLSVLEKMQPASGGYLEAIPLTSFVVMGLASSGKFNHMVVERGIRFLQDTVREDGSWPIDTNLATWTTTLAVNALDTSSIHMSVRSNEIDEPSKLTTVGSRRSLNVEGCWRWLLSCQHQNIHSFTGASPGGWGWTDLSGAVPDADDTSGAMLALDRFMAANASSVDLCERSEKAARDASNWLLELQNRDGGWPTFCRGWGRLPFDRSGTDLTAHALRALHRWRHVCPASRCDRATDRGWRYLERMQNDDGSWTPLWFGNQGYVGEENPIYGTSRVLLAYRDAGRHDSPIARRGYAFLLSEQADDGGWGAPRITHSGESSVGDVGAGSVEETSLAIEGLLPAKAVPALSNTTETALKRGLEWLFRSIEAGGHRQASPIGLYFAKLWYYEKLYPLTFAVSALRAALEAPLQTSRSAVAAEPSSIDGV